MINRTSIKVQVKKAIKQMPSTAVIKRAILNDFNEPTGEEKEIITLDGFYHKETSRSKVSLLISDGGKVKRGAPEEKFLVIYDEQSKDINEGDYLVIKNKKYKIVDLGEIYEIFMDMILERM